MIAKTPISPHTAAMISRRRSRLIFAPDCSIQPVSAVPRALPKHAGRVPAARPAVSLSRDAPGASGLTGALTTSSRRWSSFRCSIIPGSFHGDVRAHHEHQPDADDERERDTSVITAPP
jgi:hypothetical protein